jgi:two-component system nitrogen regulation sensor histidine kinase GlnL
MSSSPARTRNPERTLTQGTENPPLEGLARAIHQLQGACSRLSSSVEGVNTDLETSNRQLADALNVHSETARYLKDVLAAIPSGVIVVDRQGRIVLFNKAAEAITGFGACEVEGRGYGEILGKGVPRKHTPLYTLATGSCLAQEEKTMVARSGEEVPVSSSTGLIGGDRMAGAIEVIVDLRKMKTLEQEVERIRTLAAAGELAAVVAHEIRNPLGGIKGFASLLERDLRSSPGPLALLERIKAGIESLEGIVDDLLEAGKSTKLEFHNTELSSDVLRVVEMCKMAAMGEGKRIEFDVSTPDPPVYCRVDSARIKQALANLIRNAIEAAGDGGRVTVELRIGVGKHREAPDDPGTWGDYLSIEVTDTGAGIPAGETEKVFAPFFTTKSGGTGLGLPTVRRIVGLHGGEVEYSSPDSGGSTFTMTIPRW